MGRAFIFTLLFLSYSVKSWSQISAEYIQHNALPLSSTIQPDKDLYAKLKDYKAILIGEMHGTREPAEFVTGLAKLFSAHGREVLIGVEISEDVLGNFPKALSKASLAQSFFFKEGYDDGRNNSAWANMLLSVADLPNVQFVFYDVNAQDAEKEGDRDSLMYIRINNALKRNPGAVLISISGRLHSLLKPLDYITPLGYYLKNEKGSMVSGAKILSVRHKYSGGTMYNATMDGDLMVRKVLLSEDDLYGSAAPSERYFLLLPSEAEGYNAVLFTRKVTASTEWLSKD